MRKKHFRTIIITLVLLIIVSSVSAVTAFADVRSPYVELCETVSRYRQLQSDINADYLHLAAAHGAESRQWKEYNQNLRNLNIALLDGDVIERGGDHGGTTNYAGYITAIKDAYYEFNDSFQSLRAADYDSKGDVNGFTGGLMSLVNKLWNDVGGVISNFATSRNAGIVPGISSYNVDDIKNFANGLSATIKYAAYLVIILLFGINVIDTSLQFELMTIKGGIKVFGRLLLAKIWVDLSIDICCYALSIINSIGAAIVANGFTATGNLLPNFELGSVLSGVVTLIPFIGPLMAQIFNAAYVIPIILMCLAIIVAIVAICVKLIIRTLELVCLTTVSPIMFATLTGESTKRYFMKFMSTFLSTAGSIVFIAIVYKIGSEWIRAMSVENYSNMWEFLGFALPRLMVVIGVSCVIVKPPKALTSLFD